MTDYCIECEFTLAELVERVNALMREGYRPVGGPFGWSDGVVSPMICQAMIKEIKDAQT